MASGIDYQRDYAFGYALYGVRSPPKEDHVLLRVQHWSSSADRTGRKVGTAANTSQEEEDITSADHEEDLGLWVGLRPARGGVLRQHNPEPVGDDTETQTALAEIKDKIKKTKNTTPRSVDSLSELGALPIWPLEADMTRVVVKYDKRAAKLIYFELVNRDPVTKLCVARTVTAADCFFFHAYRDDSASTYRDRSKGWGHVIRDHITKGTNIPLDITAMINRFAVAAEEWMLDKVAKAIAKANEEPGTLSMPEVFAIYRLLDLNATFEAKDAQEAHRWMTDEFPNLMKTATLTPENLLKYATYSRKELIHGSYSTLRMDLGIYLLDDARHSGNLPNADGDDSQAERMSNARLFHSEDTQPSPLNFEEAPTDLRPWLRNHLGLVDFMVDAHSTLGMPLIRRYGAAAYDYVGQLSGEVENLAREEAAKQIIIQAVEYAVREISTKCNGVIAKMEPYMEELKSAIKNLVEEQTDDEDIMEED